MKKLINFLQEGLKIGKNYKYKKRYYPENIKELRTLIEQRLEKDKNADLNDIDVSNIDTFVETHGEFCPIGLFEGLDPYNINISDWNTSNVKQMKRVFYGCKNLTCNISEWDVSNVETMSNMFYDCKKFDCDLSGWNLNKCKNLYGVFVRCYNFKGKGLEKWNVSNVVKFNHMFNGCKKLEVDLSKWKVHLLTNEYYYMFCDCDTLDKKQLIPSWYNGTV